MALGNFKCAVCGTRYPYSAGQCTFCGRVAVIWDGAQDEAERREREEQEAREQGRQRAEAAAAAGKNSSSKDKPVPPALQPSWSTKFAVLAFIATGTALAAYDHDGVIILIGAAVAAGIAGAFYRQILVVAGIIAAIWIIAAVVGDDKPSNSSRPYITSTPPPPPPPKPWIANQPSGYPHVLTGEVRDTFVPELGYDWVDRNAKTVAWKPGIQDPKNPRLLTSFKEGMWTDRLGYLFRLQGREERARDAARTAPQAPPPDVQGKLFASQKDFGLFCNSFESCAIYHGLTISYEAISHLEYHEDQNWIVVVMNDGRRLDLGALIGPEIRPGWRQMVYIEIARTKNGEVVESRRLDQFTLRDGMTNARLESYSVGFRGENIHDYEFEGARYVGGIAITEVLPDTPAHRAGLRNDDIIFSIDDKAALTVNSFSKAVRDKHGAAVKVGVIRGAKIQDIRIQPVLVERSAM